MRIGFKLQFPGKWGLNSAEVVGYDSMVATLFLSDGTSHSWALLFCSGRAYIYLARALVPAVSVMG